MLWEFSRYIFHLSDFPWDVGHVKAAFQPASPTRSNKPCPLQVWLRVKHVQGASQCHFTANTIKTTAILSFTVETHPAITALIMTDLFAVQGKPRNCCQGTVVRKWVGMEGVCVWVCAVFGDMENDVLSNYTNVVGLLNPTSYFTI